jgi:hypothetical protein
MDRDKKEKGTIHKASLDSDRLMRVFNVLRRGPHTTKQIQLAEPSITNPPTAICELKKNGIPIEDKPFGRTKIYWLPEGQLDLTVLMGRKGA